MPKAQRLKKHFDLLKVLKNSKPNQRKALLQAVEEPVIICICECVKNILYGNVKLNGSRKKTLAKHANLMRKLIDRKTKTAQKRRLLIQSGGFLPALLAPIIGIASGLIGDLVGKLV